MSKWEPLSIESKREIVEELLNNEIHVLDEEDLRLGCALPLTLGLHKVPKEVIDNIGAILGRYKDAMPRCVNGRPMFHTVQLVNKEEWEEIATTFNKAMQAREMAVAEAFKEEA